MQRLATRPLTSAIAAVKSDGPALSRIVHLRNLTLQRGGARFGGQSESASAGAAIAVRRAKLCDADCGAWVAPIVRCPVGELGPSAELAAYAIIVATARRAATRGQLGRPRA
jgi:hypothetical protein